MHRNYTIRLATTIFATVMAFLAGALGAEEIFGDIDLRWWEIPLTVIAVGVWTWNAYAAYPGKPVKAAPED